ncbi:MAG: TonB family protein [Bacteroidales bacterium]|jgi:protein TonB|nr:TonB family protein [Bacteroidales bacterium]
MVRDINLNSEAWRDLIFDGKNKKYGAYYLRRTSDKRHYRAMLVVLGLVVVAVLLPHIIEIVTPEQAVEVEVGTTELSNVEMEQTEEKIIKEPEAPEPPKLIATIQFVPPKMVEREEMKEEVEIATTEEVIENKDAIGTQTIKSDSRDGEHIDDLHTIVVPAPKDEEEKIFQVAEQQPTYPGGLAELMKYLNANLKYPPIAAEQGIQGRVTVQFVVSKTGAISQVKVLQPLHPSCDREAERLIKSMPNWIPGRQNGNPVNVYYTVPIRFKLEDGN